MKKFLNIVVVFLNLVFIVINVLFFSLWKDSYERYEDISYGEYERQTFNLCLPRNHSDYVGLILVIHGGAWVGGDKSGCDKDLDKWCKKGYATAAINYHFISNEFYCDDIMNDISLSLKKIKDFAKVKNVNINKLMLVGSSAGGHLSLLYSYKYRDISPIDLVAVASYSGPTDLTDEWYYVNNENSNGYLDLFSNLCHMTFTEDNYFTSIMEEKLLEYSPISYISESSVPTLICHGKKDDVVPYSNAVILKEKLDLYGVKNDFVSYENSGHSLGGDKEQSKKANELFLLYASTYLK